MLQFQEVLQRRADAEIFYEWANAKSTGLTVTFDIYWYDLRYFEKRKNAFRVGAHPLVFQRFGLRPQDFLVRHELQCIGPHESRT